MNHEAVCRAAPGFPGWANKPAAQAAGQTFPDATPPVGKIHPFSKIAVTLNQYSDLDAFQYL